MTDAFRELMAEERRSGASRTLAERLAGLPEVVAKRRTTNDERVKSERHEAAGTDEVHSHDSRGDKTFTVG